MTKLSETIICVDCNAERQITKACLGLVIRCKSCQKEFNRDRARNRYREIKGIPLDSPIRKNEPKKPKKSSLTKVPKKLNKNKTKEVAPSISEEHVVKPQTKEPVDPFKVDETRVRALDRIIAMFDNDPDFHTVDDW